LAIQERNKKMTKKLFSIYLFLAIIMFSSCGKRLVPSIDGVKPIRNYDQPAFNYLYVEAVKQKLMGNPGDALQYLEECIKINPASDAAYYQMAQILISGGDLNNAKKYLSKAIKIDEKNLWYLVTMSGIYYQQQNIDSAIVYYEKAVQYFPDRENLQLTLGSLYSENSLYDKASGIFDDFDRRYGINDKSTVSAVKNMILAKRFDEAQDKTEMLLKQDPDQILYNDLLAEIYRARGDQQKALDVYKQLTDRNPDNPEIQLSLCDFLITEKSYEELFLILTPVIMNNKISREDKLALMARLIEDKEISKENGQKLLLSLMVLEASYKEDDIIPLLRPEILINMGRYEEAAQRLEEIIKDFPDNYYAWEKLLLIYLEMQDFKNLLIKGEECSSRFNRSFIAKVLYANAAIELEKYSVATEELRKAEILAGDNLEMINQVLTMRADLYYRIKDYTKSFEIFEELLKTNNEDLIVLNNYAYFLAEQNLKLKEAEDMARRVIEKDPENTTFLDTYGWVLYKRGKLKEAAAVMETIIASTDKGDAEWYEHYGYILKEQKKCDKAIENWNLALKLDSSKVNLIKAIEDCKK